MKGIRTVPICKYMIMYKIPKECTKKKKIPRTNK